MKISVCFYENIYLVTFWTRFGVLSTHLVDNKDLIDTQQITYGHINFWNKFTNTGIVGSKVFRIELYCVRVDGI